MEKQHLQINKNKLGLVFGIFAALTHTVWVLFVGIMPHAMQKFLNWISALHLVKPMHIIESFNLGHALTLIVVSFIWAYIMGWILAAIWNVVNKR